MGAEGRMKKLWRKTEEFLRWADGSKLWVLGLVAAVVVFAPYVWMGEASAFPWHDQLDENILHYVLNARHMGDLANSLPEMMCGINRSAMTPYGVLFVPLYVVFKPFAAFVIQYLIVFAMAFGGMYGLIKYLTKSSFLALISAGMFAMLPFFPVYGASVAGIPLAVWAIILLKDKKCLPVAYGGLVLYTVTSSLFFTGYSVMLFWLVYLVYLAIAKKINIHCIIGFVGTGLIFTAINFRLFVEFLVPSYGFESSRSEYFNYALSFWGVFKESLFAGGYDADSLARYIVWPVVAVCIVGLVLYRKLSDNHRKALRLSAVFLALILICSVLAGFFSGEFYSTFANNTDSFLHSFQIDRFFWLVPGLWWALLGLSAAIFWPDKDTTGKRTVCLVAICVILIPSIILVLKNSYLNISVNQMNNGSDVTGYISWEAYYSEDVMAQVEEAIGEDMSTYRVAHIGMNPTPALMHGFYTVDGYANSYELSYKHRFREIIAEEIEQNAETAAYFDDWGSRCYLFNSQSGTAFMIKKDSGAKYTNLKYDWDKLKELGANYIFSAGEITDAKDCGLELLGYFSSETSYWGIWVYKI